MKKNGLIIISIIIFISVWSITSCSLDTVISESYLNEGGILEVPDIDIEEEELKSIKATDSNMKKSFDPETGKFPGDDIRDPFKPFYFDEEEKENTLMLASIYTVEGIEYAEVVFNNSKYRLVEEDSFQEVYLVKAINETSITLLKGDELLTLYMNEMILD